MVTLVPKVRAIPQEMRLITVKLINLTNFPHHRLDFYEISIGLVIYENNRAKYDSAHCDLLNLQSPSSIVEQLEFDLGLGSLIAFQWWRGEEANMSK
jgi:hypothetical protein